MTHLNPKRHNLPVALLLSMLLLLVPALPSSALTGQPREATVHSKICLIDWRQGAWFVKKLIRCAATRYHVPGGAAVALAIAQRESRFHPSAYNASSGALGIYQHLRRYWPGRASTYGFGGWSGFNARANILVTIRMVKRLGSWWPWGG